MERKNVDLLRVFHFFHRVFHIRQVERYKLWEGFRHFTICILKKIFFTIRSLTFDARGTARILSRFASAHRGSLSLPSERTCLSLWERWPREARTERAYIQSILFSSLFYLHSYIIPSVFACGRSISPYPRGGWQRMLYLHLLTKKICDLLRNIVVF